MADPVPVVIVEDDRGYRDSLELLFAHSPGFRVAAVYEDAEDAVAAARAGGAAGWGLALMDLQMQRLGGIEGTRQLKGVASHLSVIVLTVFEDPATIVQAICAGADGYLLKKTPPAELIASCAQVLRGGAPLTNQVARIVLDVVRGQVPRRSTVDVGLSPREHEVLAQLVEGRSYKQVAAELGIGIDTVRTYIRSLYKKLQVHSVAEAVSRALREGLV